MNSKNKLTEPITLNKTITSLIQDDFFYRKSPANRERCSSCFLKGSESWGMVSLVATNKVLVLFSNKINSMLEEKNRNVEQLKNLLPEFKVFRDTCRTFSESISKLPSKVLVP
jgi:hypothetical protein